MKLYGSPKLVRGAPAPDITPSKTLTLSEGQRKQYEIYRDPNGDPAELRGLYATPLEWEEIKAFVAEVKARREK